MEEIRKQVAELAKAGSRKISVKGLANTGAVTAHHDFAHQIEMQKDHMDIQDMNTVSLGRDTSATEFEKLVKKIQEIEERLRLKDLEIADIRRDIVQLRGV